ncbi:MAG: M20/M25/M40 family metallo-hydrolase, partial [Gammaproteobacteria bacterium]
MDTLELAQKLIRIESVTPKDGGCMDLIIEQLQPLGFIAERLAFGEGAERVDNLWLRLGTAKPLFCFLGHTDVVPTGPESHWHYPPFAATARDGWLHGRGAADMKSGIAAMVGACRQFLQEAPLQQGSIALLLT